MFVFLFLHPFRFLYLLNFGFLNVPTRLSAKADLIGPLALSISIHQTVAWARPAFGEAGGVMDEAPIFDRETGQRIAQVVKPPETSDFPCAITFCFTFSHPFAQVVKTAVEGLSENSSFVPNLECNMQWRMLAELFSFHHLDFYFCKFKASDSLHLRVDKIKGDAKAGHSSDVGII